MAKEIYGITKGNFGVENAEGMDSRVVAFGLDDDLCIVATEHRCTKEGCNCVGGWTNGDDMRVAVWVREEQFCN